MNDLSIFRYAYQAECFPCGFSVSKLQGSIKPNETIMHEYILKSNEVKDYEFEVPCCINAEIGGRTCLVKPEVSAKSTIGSLMVIITDFDKNKYNFF